MNCRTGLTLSRAVQLLNVVPEGKEPMDGTAFAAGQRLKTGDIL